MKLPKQYDPHEHEPRMYTKWEDARVFHPRFSKTSTSARAFAQGYGLHSKATADKPRGKPFVIMLPLPNVTGSLHMGHALQHTLSDVLIRYHRMKGEPTLWQPGTDHAGIATQNVVEKELRKEGLTRHDLGREKFLEKVWEWKEKYGNEIVEQMKRMGMSCDWDRFVFTMDEKYVSAVHEAFIRYHKRGYIYRGNRIVNWCPRCASVISDLEIKREDRDGTLYTLRYPMKDSDQSIEVATTRPETMLGDTAVAVHPDGKYKSAVGKILVLPLMNREIPIIADERVDESFGTGAVKVTPAHDMLDAEIGETHHLDTINVIGEDGTITKAGGAYAGMTVMEARKHILAGLKDRKLFVGEEGYRHTITLCERCGTVIEPLLSRQWFVDMSKLRDETIEVVEKEIVRFFGPRWKRHFLEWMNNVKDWTISRQLWWGQPVPVWWKPGTRGTDSEEGNYIVATSKPKGTYEQDPDVLDTWFSSAIWPLATLGWPKNSKDLQLFYPTSVLATAREILYLWVARMMFSGLELLKGDEYGREKLEGRIPFYHILIHPTVLTKDGKRMSKSLGTGIDPMDLVTRYGADATRFGLMYQTSYDSQAVRFDEAAIVSARNFANKIWNLSRLVDSLPNREEETIADAWIKSRLGSTALAVSTLLDEYKVGEAARALYDFTWKDFADWYVEIVKVEGSTTCAKNTFSQLLCLLHPFMPHITEAAWEHLGNEGLLATSPWVKTSQRKGDASVLETMQYFKDVVSTVRGARALLELPPQSVVTIHIKETPSLTSSLEKLARGRLVSRAEKQMKRFPLQCGKAVRLGSEEITEERLTRVREKLEKELSDTQDVIANQESILQKMHTKAPKERIKEKEHAIRQLQERSKNIRQSIDILTS